MIFKEWLDSLHITDLTTEAYELAELAWQEAQTEQIKLCVAAIQDCELVAPNVKRIRLHEAVGACFNAK